MIRWEGLLGMRILNETVDRYCDILNEIVVPVMQNAENEHCLLQLDGAPPHYAIAAREIFNRDLQNRWVGRGQTKWPARSPDLRVFSDNMRHLNEFEVYHTLLLLRQGQSLRQVARQLDVSPSVVPKLRNRHRETARLRFAENHADWNMNQWQSVLFSDESRYRLTRCDDRLRVWERPRESFSVRVVQEINRFGGGSIMDNARAHSAAVTRNFLRENEIDVMECPAISPGLNPIEHLWEILDTKVRNRHQVLQTLQELGDALKEEWENIPKRIYRIS
ncbi:hypothetical protein ANN_21322 [Periplaneta americana]|uniref:Tc1-like transposase DDE domain-containing protein n=1 Tax=Periplaneta americana TaxID=6978 RepID=A0ABQ8SFF9_PERAM|nr:hypothetical protein ANN_21322 [Periplaneta americana]